MHIIDGKKIAKEIEGRVKTKARGKKIKIATLVYEKNEESMLFSKLKERAFERVGFEYETIYFDKLDETKLRKKIKKLNEDDEITGINIQLPMPGIDYNKIIKEINVKKDIEGMHPFNIGSTLLGDEKLIPCTPKAILRIIEYEGIKLEGKNVVIINHSNIVGKPLAMLLLNRNATVAVCHVYTKNLKEYTKRADLLITATGARGLIKDEHVKEGVIIIDAGIKKEGGRIYGDVDESAARMARAITPVPGGVGPVTIASMLENALLAYEMQKSL
ncbi:MAG: bifunctional 5,10-methylenetetrahydrofolate dehydrogenase/5,10-methenyltetrahydrofolate cyclohydrolase [Thermoplasmata archaeon]|nr:MAG: bifunctional 5,10-methylenetetrahydrofolate dehydrogenase/5,10-methenyltetrahydrofolate cyclohydrolase [Thermoplasmata archaeon]